MKQILDSGQPLLEAIEMAEKETGGSSDGSAEVDNPNTNVEKDNFTTCPKIPQIFIDKSVLVTGATGFLGKVLVEKLLRSCPGVKEILLLIRQSKKGSVENRLIDYKQHHIFDRLRKEAPTALDKLKVLTGDVVQHNAGLCAGQLQKVITDVSFVFHCAANVRFDDEARETLNVNLVGVQNVLDLCKAFQKLEALVHVSTAYAFCNNSIVSEQLYPEYVTPQNIIEVTKWMTNWELKTVCMHYIQGRPSLYHFSKAMAEILLSETKQNVPVIIVRPSIVTAAVEDPYPGWIDNYNGPSGFIHVCGKGVVRTLLVDPKVNADWVPVDTVVNTLIAAAHYLVVNKKYKCAKKLDAAEGIPIINCTCPPKNVITWMKVADVLVPLLQKYPSKDVIRKPGGTVTSSPMLYFVFRLTYHYLPALLLDIASLLLWRKPCMISVYRKIHGVLNHLQYYNTHLFIFNSNNMRSLVELMDPDDRKVFPIDLSILDWNKYLENYVLGVRRYFSRQPDDTLPAVRKRMMRFYYLWLLLKLSSMYGIVMFMKYLYKRGSMRTALQTSLPVFGMMITRTQKKRLHADM